MRANDPMYQVVLDNNSPPQPLFSTSLASLVEDEEGNCECAYGIAQMFECLDM